MSMSRCSSAINRSAIARRLVTFCLLGVLLSTSAVTLAQSSAHFDQPTYVIAGGSQRSASAGYVVWSTIGQASAGPPVATSSRYRVTGGFWGQVPDGVAANSETIYLPVILR